MSRSSIFQLLAKVYHCEWNPDRTTTLNQLVSLVSYYGDGDMPESIRMDCNKLIGIVVKIELMKRQSIKPIEFPSCYACRLEDHNGKVAQLDSFTFSPTFNLTNCPVKKDNWSELDEIKKEIAGIDIAGMLIYVREKAIAANHLSAELDT